MRFHRSFHGVLARKRPFALDPDGFERRRRGNAKLFVVVHDEHMPFGQDHFFFRRFHPFEVEHDMELRALARFAFHLDAALHGIYDILRDRHAESRALGLMHAGVVLARKRLENFRHEAGRHADARIVDADMVADEVFAERRAFLHERNIDMPVFGREFDRVRQKI